jgi:hypothetical protein
MITVIIIVISPTDVCGEVNIEVHTIFVPYIEIRSKRLSRLAREPYDKIVCTDNRTSKHV